jgi:nitrite reductase/ring-hydroxylating ferredoxin subunit
MSEQPHTLCRLDALPEHGARGFPLPGEADPQALIVVRWNDRVFGYRNRCPHTGAPLNWMPDRFFDIDDRLLQCSLHMALFEPDSGLCVYGPCHGRSLPGVALEVVDGWVRLATECEAAARPQR